MALAGPMKRKRKHVFSPAKILGSILRNLIDTGVNIDSIDWERHVVLRAPVTGKYKNAETWINYQAEFENDPQALDKANDLVEAFARAMSRKHRRETVFRGNLASMDEDGEITSEKWISISSHAGFATAREYALHFLERFKVKGLEKYLKKDGLESIAWIGFAVDSREPVRAERKHAKKVHKKKRKRKGKGK